jgi:signal transduction histidine kinase
MKYSKSSLAVFGAWILALGGYCAASWLPAGNFPADARNFIEGVVPIFANGCLLWNAASPYRRRNAFWKLLALSCTLLLLGRLLQMYDELVLHQPASHFILINGLRFLHVVPLIAAVALAPHKRDMKAPLRHGILDLSLLAIVWIQIYAFVVIPWEVVSPDRNLFSQWNIATFAIQNLIVIVGFAILFACSSGSWRVIYGHILGAVTLYSGGVAFSLIYAHRAVATPFQGLSFVASLMWLGTAGFVAGRLPIPPEPAESPRGETQWQLTLSMIAVLMFPLLAAWAAFFSAAPAGVSKFRLIVTLAACFAASFLVFLRQQLSNRERTALVQQLSTSLDNVNRLQAEFVQSEKLASLGKLASGAAHEINNPLAAIIGYTDLLLDDQVPPARTRSLAEKIQEQARRTKTLVNNLLSFARQAPSEKQLLDLSAILDSAVQLRRLDLHGKNIRIDLHTPSLLPGVQGDPNQLIQVFFHLISNAVDAMESAGGGVLAVSAHAEKGTVTVEFADTGPGMKEPDKVFDPFYTTKPLGKGTGLGLSICYGIIREHGGTIAGFNRADGGCSFRLELPAVLASLPRASVAALSQRAL